MKNNLNNYAQLAHNILNADSRYSSNKNIIVSLFKTNNSNDFVFTVKNRLTVIDSYYSTQMSKRLYGIEELSEAISQCSDEELINEANEFLTDPNSNNAVNQLFSNEYGINKEGVSEKKAISLISKYLYFLTNFTFPIYDRLAFLSYKLLKSNVFKKEIKSISEENYFEIIKHLNNITGINNYEKLDNLLWLLGKLTYGSFSILMNKEDYIQLINTPQIQKGFKDLNKQSKNKSEDKDNVIRNYLRENYNNTTLFTQNQKDFFEYVFKLLER